MTKDEKVELLARAACAAHGFDPDRFWTAYRPDAISFLAMTEMAGVLSREEEGYA